MRNTIPVFIARSATHTTAAIAAVTLPLCGGWRFHALEQILVAVIVGYHQHEFGRRVQDFAGAFDGQDAAVVGKWVQNTSCAW